MILVFQSAFLKALGWSLLDSLWQMGVLWLIYIVLTRNGKKYSSLLRHNLALLSLAGGSLWFIVSLIINFQLAVNQPASTTIFSSVVYSGEGWQISQVSHLIEPTLPYLSILYLVFLFLLLVRFFIQFRQTRNLYQVSRIKTDPELRVFMRKMAALLSLKKEVRIWLSDLVDTPLTIGFWKPVILLPLAAINQLSIEQTETVILHELYHIKRNDYAINLMIAILDLLLFFNPFSRLLTDTIKKERENSCDDLVLQFRYDPRTYVNALLLLEENRINQPVFSVAATGKNRFFLLNRVKRMLYNENFSATINLRLIAALCTALVIGFIGYYNPGNVIIKSLTETNTYVAARDIAEGNQEMITSIAGTSQTITVVIEKEPTENVEIAEIAAAPEVTMDYFSFLQDEQEELTPSILSFVQTQPEIREYSLTLTEPVVPAPVYSSQYPYVPSNSFSFHYTEDTSLPKKQIITFSEKKAREALERSLMAIDEIDWKKIEKQLGVVDVRELQKEIKKALEDVNWKKINEDLESSLKESVEANAEYRLQLEKLKELRSDKQHQLKKIEEKILEDQLKKPCPEVIHVAPRKKVVVI